MTKNKFIFCILALALSLLGSLSFAQQHPPDLPQAAPQIGPAVIQPPQPQPLPQPQSVLPSVIRETFKKITGEIWKTYQIMRINKMTPEQAVRAMLKCEENFKNKEIQCYKWVSDPEYIEQQRRCSDLISGRDNLPYRGLNWLQQEDMRKLNNTIDNCFAILNLFNKRVEGCFREAKDEYGKCYRDLGLRRVIKQF